MSYRRGIKYQYVHAYRFSFSMRAGRLLSDFRAQYRWGSLQERRSGHRNVSSYCLSTTRAICRTSRWFLYYRSKRLAMEYLDCCDCRRSGNLFWIPHVSRNVQGETCATKSRETSQKYWQRKFAIEVWKFGETCRFEGFFVAANQNAVPFANCVYHIFLHGSGVRNLLCHSYHSHSNPRG